MSNFICLVLCLSIVVVLAFANRPLRVAAARNELQTTGQGEKTVDKSRKNIQVLKGLPESQLFLLMNFVATSLGVECNFCHVQQGKDPNTGRTKWVWEVMTSLKNILPGR